MKIIEQSHEFIHEDDPMKLIEIAGRNCYKSEDKITDDSAKRFVQMITKAGHYSVLEHASVCFDVNVETVKWIRNILWEYESEEEYFNEANYFRITDTDRCLISGNFRCWLEFFEAFSFDQYPSDLQMIHTYLHFEYPKIFPKPPFIITGYINTISEAWMSAWEKLIHTTRTCRFITNRGVTHELVRHRKFSFSQESTRYVKYDGNMEFIRPVWLNSPSTEVNEALAILTFENHCIKSEESYKNLLKLGWQPQQAREVLPNSLKTEIVCTAPLAEWKHLLGLRTSKAAHPQIRALMTPVLAELKESLPEIF